MLLAAVLIWGLVIPAFAVTVALLFSGIQARRFRGIERPGAAELRRIARRMPVQRSRRGSCEITTAGSARRPAVRRAHG